MALDETVLVLADNFYVAFDAMKNMTENNDSYFAEQVAKAFTDWYNGGTVTTIGSGEFYGNAIITASGQGSPNAPPDPIESLILTACASMNGENSVLALAMGNGITTSVALPVQLDVNGMMAVPVGTGIVPTPFNGNSIGTVDPVLAALTVVLTDIFNSMNGQPEGTDGNRYLADKIASALSVLSGAPVSSIGIPPLSGGGTGSIT